MAKTIIEGAVHHVIRQGVGIRVRETWQNKEGVEQGRYWTVWMPDGQVTPVAVGDVVTATGRLSMRVSERDPRYIDTSLQRATVTLTAPDGEVWIEPQYAHPASARV